MTAEQKNPFILTQRRWQIALAACLGLVIAQGMRCNFPAAKIAMMESNRFNWTEHEIANFESAYFYGYGLSQIPAGLLATEFSPTKLYGCAIVLAGVCNILTAVAFSYNINIAVILVQVAQGIVVGLTQPAIHGVLRAWAPPQERSELASTAFNGMYLGVMFGVALSGALSAIHWSLSFYFYGGLSIIWVFLWFGVSASCPKKHRSITEAERHYIVSSIGEHQADHVKLSEVPWMGMLTSVPVWATVIVNCALNWNLYMFVNQQLYYLNSVFGIAAEQAGFIIAPSQLLQAFMVTMTAAFSDHLLSSKRFSKTFIRKGFMALGFLGQTLCLIGLGTIAFNSYIAVFLMVLSSGSIGCSLASFMVNQFDIAPFFAPIVLGFDNTIGAIAGINGFVVEPLAAEGERGWQICFLIGAVINVVGLLSFQFFGSVDIQLWAKHGEESVKNSRKNLELEAASAKNLEEFGDSGPPGQSEERNDGEQNEEAAEAKHIDIDLGPTEDDLADEKHKVDV